MEESGGAKKKEVILIAVLTVVGIAVVLAFIGLMAWQLFGWTPLDIFRTIGVAAPEILAIRTRSTVIYFDYTIIVSFEVKNNNSRSMKALVGITLDYDKQWYKEMEITIPPKRITEFSKYFYEPEFLGSMFEDRILVRIKVIKYSLVND